MPAVVLILKYQMRQMTNFRQKKKKKKQIKNFTGPIWIHQFSVTPLLIRSMLLQCTQVFCIIFNVCFVVDSIIDFNLALLPGSALFFFSILSVVVHFSCLDHCAFLF